MASPFFVPDDLVAQTAQHSDAKAAWVKQLPALATELARKWRLVPDGSPWSGTLSAVWPVRAADGTPLVLKVVYPDPKTYGEAAALQTWSGVGGTVECVAADLEHHALLLERLNGDVSLETYPDIDEACAVVGALLASLHDVRPFDGVRTVAQEAAEIADQIRGLSARYPALVASRWVDQALETLSDLQSTDRPVWLLHADCHFLNVLRTVDGTGWRAIDPLPAAGPREWELLPILRNRWADALATGDPEAALCRRVDQLSELLGADAGQARRLAQAGSVLMLLDLVPTEPGHFFVPPHTLMVHWTR